jgi:hypothetical protein
LNFGLIFYKKRWIDAKYLLLTHQMAVSISVENSYKTIYIKNYLHISPNFAIMTI